MGNKQPIRYQLAEVPADIRVCIKRLTKAPDQGSLSSKQAAQLIVRLRSAEVQKTQCGQRLLTLYESQQWRP